MGAVRRDEHTELPLTGTVLAAGANSTASFELATTSGGGFSDPDRFGFGLWWDKQKEVSTGYHVSNNGNLTWNGTFTDKTPQPLRDLRDAALPIFCPFWADIDTTSTGTVTVKEAFELLPSATSGQPSSDFYPMGFGAFVITWEDVPPPGGGPERNTFQLVVHSRLDAGPLDIHGGAVYTPYVDFDVEFNYDKVEWDNSGRFRIGFASGEEVSGQHYEFPGSGYAGYYLDGAPNALISHSHNSTVLGRYVFRFRTTPKQFAKHVTGEGLIQNEDVEEFYNNGLGALGSGPGPAYGISFTNGRVQIGRDNAPATPGSYFPYAGSGHKSIYATASPLTINIPGGFYREFSCAHYVVGGDATFRFHSEVDGGGDLLKELEVPAPSTAYFGNNRWRTLVTPINFTTEGIDNLVAIRPKSVTVSGGVAPTITTPTHIVTESSAVSGTTHTTTAFQTMANWLFLCWVTNIGPAPFNMSKSGMTWSMATSVNFHTTTTPTRRLTLFYGTGSGTTTSAASFFFSTPASACAWSIIRFSPIGGATTPSLIQSKTNAQNSGGSATLTTTLTSAVLAGNATAAGHASNSNSLLFTPGSGWSEIGEVITPSVGGASLLSLQSQWSNGLQDDVTTFILTEPVPALAAIVAEVGLSLAAGGGSLIALDSIRFGQYWAGSQGIIPGAPPPRSGCAAPEPPEGSFPNGQEPIPGEIVFPATPIPGPPIPTVVIDEAEAVAASRARRRVRR